MLLSRIQILKFLSLSVLCTGCIVPFNPNSSEETGNQLVVDGDIIANGTTVVRLSRSLKLSSEMSESMERYARIDVESSSGVFYPARETSPGIYEAATYELDLSALYRLNITTRSGKTYASEFVPVSVSSNIDSLYYEVDMNNRNVNIYMSSSSNSAHSTHYHRWECDQDWEFTSSYKADITFNPTLMRYTQFPVGYDIYTCYGNETSSTIMLANTSDLSSGVIANEKILTIPAGDRRLSGLYCVQVNLRGLSQEAFRFWNVLLKNNTQLGGIFAPQPSEQRGNITCLSQPDEVVIGFINATTITLSKRLFIERPFPVKPLCSEDDLISVDVNDLSSAMELSSGHYLPLYGTVEGESRPRDVIVWAPAGCVDCTTRGTKNRPSWWPND